MALDPWQVTRDGVTAIEFHPSSNGLLLAAGDKKGNVAMWKLDSDRAEGEQPLIFSFPIHAQYVSGVRWLGQRATPSLLASSSYDGSVRMLDVEAGLFTKVRLIDGFGIMVGVHASWQGFSFLG